MSEETSDQQYCSTSDIPRLTQQQNGRTLIHVNIRSLQKNFSKLEIFLQELNITPNFIFLSETWTTPDSFFRPILVGYDFLSQPSTSLAGGVAIFIKNGTKYKIRDDLEMKLPLVENLWIETVTDDMKKELFAVIYRHPGYDYSDFKNVFEKNNF